LAPATGVDGACDSEAVELAHELPGRIELRIAAEFGCAGDRAVEQRGVRCGDEQAGRLAAAVALDLGAGRVGRLARVAERT